jgi:succinate dehydrogenase / fumarate reductase, cytochrome b subunit
MLQNSSTLWSTVGKKLLMGLTGLFLVAFLVIHLAGNLTLMTGVPDYINIYAHFLHKFGWIIETLEIGLGLLFLFHLFVGSWVTFFNWRSRPVRYRKVKGAGHTSHKSIGSSTMIYSGLIVIVFLVVHLFHFKFADPARMSLVHGEQIWDLYGIVKDFFSNGWNVLAYELVMVVLGFHLSHGFWSAFQSLGLTGNRYLPIIYGLGIVVAVLLAGGFVVIPLWLYFL